MDSTSARRKAETVLEYALYAAILMMTVSGAFLYTAIVHDPLMSAFTTYLIVAYLVFLALAFGQLNRLHRKRPRPVPQPRTYAVKSPRPILGLSAKQLAIVAFVFVTACVTFTWALSIVR
jgi:drug/metabolite transporter (DMT)-like permease